MSAFVQNGWIAPVVQAGSSLLGNIFNLGQNRANRQWSEKMYGRQLADTKEMTNAHRQWQEQMVRQEREYNDYSSVVERAKKAGVNIATALGGNPTASHASQASGAVQAAPSAQTPSIQPYDLSGLGQAGSTWQNIQFAKQRLENETEYNRAMVLLAASNRENVEADTAGKILSNEFSRASFSARLDSISTDIAKTRSEIALNEQQFTLLNPAQARLLDATANKYLSDVETALHYQAYLDSGTAVNHKQAAYIQEQIESINLEQSMFELRTEYMKAKTDLIRAQERYTNQLKSESLSREERMAIENELTKAQTELVEIEQWYTGVSTAAAAIGVANGALDLFDKSGNLFKKRPSVGYGRDGAGGTKKAAMDWKKIWDNGKKAASAAGKYGKVAAGPLAALGGTGILVSGGDSSPSQIAYKKREQWEEFRRSPYFRYYLKSKWREEYKKHRNYEIRY